MEQEIHFGEDAYIINDKSGQRLYIAKLPSPLLAQDLYNSLPNDYQYKNIVFEKLAENYTIPKDRVFTVRENWKALHFRTYNVKDLDYIIYVIKNPNAYKYEIDYYSYNPSEGSRGFWPPDLQSYK